jgi:diketogulonate reductase-like aldo/keto reductase
MAESESLWAKGDQEPTINQQMKDMRTKIMSWGPFAEGRNDFFTNPTLQEIGKEYGKSVAQVALRYLIQRDIIVIPKSTHKERMMENFNVFDFSLAPDDMAAIAALDTAKTLFFSHYDPEMVKWLINYGK